MPHDIFVSYAHSDDAPSGIAEHGGVTTFVEELKKLLRAKLGGNGPDVWMDHYLAANERVTETLRDHVVGSRIILLFMSPGYLASRWCGFELQQFLASHEALFHRENAFVVAWSETKRDQWPLRLQALKPTELYVAEITGVPRLLWWPNLPQDTDSLYWKRMNELAHCICNHLKQSGSFTPHVVIPPRPRVWIAQTTPELTREWESLASAITQAGAQVVPSAANNYSYADATAFKQAASTDLLSANLLIQLLGQDAGPSIGSTVGNSMGTTTDQLALLQNNMAAALMSELHPKMLRWRNHPARLDVGIEALDDYQRLLLGAIDCHFEQFRSLVLGEVQRLLTPSVPSKQAVVQSGGILSLCVMGAEQDKALAKEVCQIVQNLGDVPYATESKPAAGQSREEYREQITDLLSNVDGVILVHGHAPETWLNAQHAQMRKILGQRKQTLWGAFLDGPPPDKADSLGCTWPGLLTLACRHGQLEQAIANFLQQLRLGVEHV